MSHSFVKSIIIPRLVLLLVVLTDVVTLFFFVMVLNRIIATDAHDFQTVLMIVASLIAVVPLWRLGNTVIIKNGMQIRALPVNGKLAVVAHLAFITITAALWALLGNISEYNYQKGLREYQNNQFSNAITLLQKSLYQDPERSDVAFALGNIYETIAETDEAKHYYLLSIYSQNSPFKAYNNLARLYIKDGLSNDGPGDIAFDQALDLLLLARRDYVSEENISNQERSEQKGIIDKNIAWAQIKLQNFESAASNVENAEKQFLASGSLAKHPEMKCMLALIAAANKNVQEGNMYAGQCRTALSRGKIEGLERSLVREVMHLYEK